MVTWKVPNSEDHFALEPIPACAGIGLRGPHYKDVLENQPQVGFLEVHSENYFGKGGLPHTYLERIRRDYPLSFHGVGLSLGSMDPLNMQHIERLKQLVDFYQPDFISEHLSWGSIGGRYLNDLLPLPYTEEAVEHLAQRIAVVQQHLERPVMVENVSCYLEFKHSHLQEWEFVGAVADRAQCDILLDINNIYVNAHNHSFDGEDFLAGIYGNRIKEIHLAGHTVKEYQQGTIIIDTHDHRVSQGVWHLYEKAIQRYGPKPTLIEWDTNLPELSVLVDEANIAENMMTEVARVRVA